MSARSRPPSDRRGAERPARRLGLLLLGSTLVHAGVLGVAGLLPLGPSLDVQFELPMDVELGLSSEIAAASAESLASTQPPTPPEEAPPTAGEEPQEIEDPSEAAPDAGPALDAAHAPDAEPAPDAGQPIDSGLDAPAQEAIADAGLPDSGPDAAEATTPADAGPEAGVEAGLPVAEADAGPGGLEALASGESRIPPGAQLALRLDLEAIRRSPLSPEVRRLLATIPDWQRLLEGSGVDPVRDLDRILIASPNMQPARMVFAGRHSQQPGFVREAARRIATSQGEQLSWGETAGLPTAPWHDADAVERVVAILGDRHFVLGRPADLPRILAIAAAREDERAEGQGEADPLEGEGPAELLLALGEGESVRFEADGARQFAPNAAPEQIPERMRLTVRELAEGAVQIDAVAFFDDAPQAALGRRFWRSQIDGQRTILSLMGFGSALGQLQLETRGRQVVLQTTLTRRQARTALGFAQDLLEGWVRDLERRRRRDASRAGSAAGAEPSPASGASAGAGEPEGAGGSSDSDALTPEDGIGGSPAQ